MQSSEVKPNFRKIFSLLIGILFLVIPLIVFEYQMNPLFQQHLRFGFEGFFSLIETGKWQVHSNDILKDMYVFPERLKTWFIGDGYLNDPYEFDTYYIGIDWKGYYQNTDVGYLRFIFYFGIFGLLAFGIYMCKVAKVCMKRFTNYRLMFLLILLLNFAIWFKVSTDIFLVFALFLCISEEENNTYEQHILSDESA